VRGERGFSLFELVIVIVILSVLLVVAVDRLLRLRFEAERATVQSVVGALRSALYVEFAAAAARRELGKMDVAGGSNPMLRLAEQPDGYAGEFFDSMAVRLLDGRISVDAVIRTGRLPSDVLGPFASAVRDREPIRADGNLRVLEPGLAGWDVQRMQVRDIPLPKDAIPRLLDRVSGDSGMREVPVRLPRGVADLRVRSDGLTLYRVRQ
jgi:prepilin-type N-terminal cleavage/methylation domain-containing protein